MAELARYARRAFVRLGCAGLLLACTGTLADAPPSGVSEDRVKAAYLNKFVSFVEWPGASFDGPSTAFEIGVTGSESVASELDRIVAGRVAGTRAIRVRRVAPGASTEGLHILYLDAALESNVIASMQAGAVGRSLLTVSDAPGATARGFMIGFVTDRDRLRFDVGLDLVAPSGLRIGARMLAVAHRVRGAT